MNTTTAPETRQSYRALVTPTPSTEPTWLPPVIVGRATDTIFAKELLLEDHKYLTDSFWKNEQIGEARVNWFIGIITAVTGGLVTLATASKPLDPEPLKFLICASLFAELVFGFATLCRVLKRNEVTDGYKKDLDTIRQTFKDRFGNSHILAEYYTLKPPPIPWQRSRSKSSENDRKFGGLVHTVATINCLLLAGLAGVAILPITPTVVSAAQSTDKTPQEVIIALLAALVAFVAGALFQNYHIRRKKAEAKNKLTQNSVNRASGIEFKIEEEICRYRLVGPQFEPNTAGGPKEWLLPKGRICDREGHGEAALREVGEETGDVAQLVGLVGYARFSCGTEKIYAKYYLMEHVCETNQGESRRKNWFTLTEIRNLQLHAEIRSLLEAAEIMRCSLMKTKAP